MMRLFSLIVFLIFSLQVSAQTGKYRYHTVLKGETLFAISQQYGIEVQEILDLNPEIDENIRPGQTLLLPYKENTSVQNDPENTYRVKAGDTWYSISKELECSVSQLQEANEEVYERGPLQIGSLLQIPEGKQVEKEKKKVAAVKDSTSNGKTYHNVSRGETWYSIARAYKTRPSVLLQLNPEHKELRADEWILVKSQNPSKSIESLATDEALSSDSTSSEKTNMNAVIGQVAVEPEETKSNIGKSQRDTTEEEASFVLYKIKADDSLESIALAFSTDQETLIRLNPELREGLEKGRYIIVPVVRPNSTSESDSTQNDTTELTSKVMKLALMLPFSDAGGDTPSAFEMGERKNGRMRFRSSAFYAGALLALEKLGQMGDSVELRVFDTANKTSILDSLSQEKSFISSHMSLGPLYGKNAEYLDKKLEGDNRPRIFSPLSANLNPRNSKELVDLYPQDEVGLQSIIELLKKESSDTLYWVAAGSGVAKEREWLETLRTELAELPWLEDGNYFFTPLEKEGYSAKDLRHLVREGRQLLIINLSVDPANMADMERKAFALNDSVILMSIHEWPASLKKDVEYLNGLRLTYPEAFFVDYNDEEVKNFVKIYRERFQAEPNVFAFQAWDCIFVMHKMWKDNFRSDIYEHKGLQSTYRLEIEDGLWKNKGLGVLRMEGYQWTRIH